MSSKKRKKLVIVGGGAAGFFAANQVIEQSDQFDITILEQGQKVLQKVKVSGGGRCNVTNASIERVQLAEYYPRGWKLLRKLFSSFSNQDTIQWFENKGIELKVEADNRMFPITDNSQTIVDGLRDIENHKNVQVITSCKVMDIHQQENKTWRITSNNKGTFNADYLLMATGSSIFIYSLLEKKTVKIVPAVPSLFTFNIPNDERLLDIPGIAVPNGKARIVGEKLTSTGPILITHWGLSGPAILKLSSWSARKLNETQYNFKVSINWINKNFEDCKSQLMELKSSHANKKIANDANFGVPKRLWKKLTHASKITDENIWKEISNKHINNLAEQLTNSIFEVKGKSTFKEEFVTCGGVALNEVNSKSLKHKTIERLYFAGEVLDVDAITGGYNFQAAWTTAFVAAQSIVKNNAIEVQ